MGQIQFSYLHANRAGTIKRVIRQGATFVCGLCRSTYQREGTALECLETCWIEILALDPVIVKPRSASVAFRCRFCARDHESRDAALDCADDCRDRHEFEFASEREMFASDSGVARARPKKRGLAVVRRMAVVPKAAKAGKISVAEAGNSVAVDVDSVMASAAAVPAAEPVAVAAADAPKKPKPDKVFYRDQAKYVCTVCHEKYFTKIEVTKCYDGH